MTGDTEIKTHSDTPATTTSLTLKRSRGTTGTPTAVHHGDTLAEIVFQGYDGDTYVKSVFIVHVGGTRCVTFSTANNMKIHVRITLTVECIRTCIFLF